MVGVIEGVGVTKGVDWVRSCTELGVGLGYHSTTIQWTMQSFPPQPSYYERPYSQ